MVYIKMSNINKNFIRDVDILSTSDSTNLKPK